jgi:hypothetical protein
LLLDISLFKEAEILKTNLFLLFRRRRSKLFDWVEASGHWTVEAEQFFLRARGVTKAGWVAVLSAGCRALVVVVADGWGTQSVGNE